MKRILVTGAFGYVGGRVSRYLAEQGYRVRLGSRDAGRQAPQWLGSGELAIMDFDSDASLEAACREVDCIVHLANTNEAVSRADPELALRVNGGGAIRLLRAAAAANVKRLIYFSTAHVYGAPLQGIIDEQSLPRPRHPYAITHRTAEDFVLSSQQVHGVVLRLSNGFGAPELGGDWVLLMNDLCRQAITQKKLVLRSSGMQRRDFVPLGDVARAVQHFTELPQERCGDSLFNLGGENPARIMDMAERIAARCEAVLGYRPEIHRPQPAVGEQSALLEYRMDKLKATGFTLQVGVDEEIDTTLRYCQQAFGAAG